MRRAYLTLFCGVGTGMWLPSLLPGLRAAIRGMVTGGIADMLLTWGPERRLNPKGISKGHR